MKIALVSGIDKRTTLTSKGGIESWTAHFAKELARRGRTVDLYAVSGSIKEKNLHTIEVLEKPIVSFFQENFFTAIPEEFQKRKEQFMATIYTSTLLSILTKEKEYDVIIDSCSYPTFTFNTIYFSRPVIIIEHFPQSFSPRFFFNHPLLLSGSSDSRMFVFPSRFQQENFDYLDKRQTYVIPHGIDLSEFIFNPYGTEDMVWLSRFHHRRMNKGLIEVIQAANAIKKRVVVYVHIEKSSREYFEDTVRPLLKSPYVDFHEVGVDDVIDKSAVLGKAKLFLFPVQWEEPFGLVMLEAMATGTPIVAFARGAVPEIVIDGETGFLVDPSPGDTRREFIIKETGMNGLYKAISRIYNMDINQYQQMRRKCRQLVEEKFALARMVDVYEALFKEMQK